MAIFSISVQDFGAESRISVELIYQNYGWHPTKLSSWQFFISYGSPTNTVV
jgi:hypothetical protein